MRDDMDEERAWRAEEKPSVVVGLKVAVNDLFVGEAAMLLGRRQLVFLEAGGSLAGVILVITRHLSRYG